MASNRKISIAIDGFSACGKSTLAKALAAHLNYNYLDTGAMYRGVTLYAMMQGWAKDGRIFVDELKAHLGDIQLDFEVNPLNGKSELQLNGKNVEKEIRTQDVAQLVSQISAIPEVRRKLQEAQRLLGKKKGVVMDGRDIGTVVMPDAELKIFMTADVDVRVKRRFEEMRSKGLDVSMDLVRENLKKRDLIDSTRVEDPLRQADDALVLDNSEISPEEQFALALSWVEMALNKQDATAK